MFDKQVCKLVSLLVVLGCGGESRFEIPTAPGATPEETAVPPEPAAAGTVSGLAPGNWAAGKLAAGKWAGENWAANANWQATVQRRIADSRYAIRKAKDERFETVSATQGFRASFDARGAELSGPGRSDVGGHLHRVHVGGAAIARDADTTPLADASLELGACRADGASDVAGKCLQRLEGRRGPVTELWENRPDGLEHSFVVHEPVMGTGHLAVWVNVENAEVTLDPDGTAARINDVGSGLALSYSGLKAWDADGVVLPARMQARSGGLALVVDDTNAAYPVMINPVLTTGNTWTAESNQESSQFGHSVAGAGDVNGDGFADVIVGALFYDNGQTDEGRAFVYLGSAIGPGDDRRLDRGEQPGGRVLRLRGRDRRRRQRRRLRRRHRRRQYCSTTGKPTRAAPSSTTAAPRARDDRRAWTAEGNQANARVRAIRSRPPATSTATASPT